MGSVSKLQGTWLLEGCVWFSSMGCPCLLPSRADKTAGLLLIAGSVQTARRRLQPGFSPNFSPPGLLLTLPHRPAAAGQILLHHSSVTLRIPGLFEPPTCAGVLWGTDAGGSRWTSGGTWVRMTWETAHSCPAGCSGTPSASCRACGEGRCEAEADLAWSLKSPCALLAGGERDG